MKTTKTKQTSIPWLGEIPEEWSAVKLKWVSNIYSGGTPTKESRRYWMDGTIPWLASGEVNQGIINQPSDHITEEALLNSSAKWIKKDSLVVALAGQGKTKGMVAYVNIKCTCNQSLGVIEPEKKINSYYLYFLLKTAYKELRGLAGEGLRDGLNLQVLGDFKILLSPIDTQKKIADYLDGKTEKIKKLVEDKKKMIELLKEQKQSMIHKAVTKGIDKNAKMKDSGVAWIGEIPKKWEIMKMKYVAEICNGKDYTDVVSEDGYPVIGSGGIFAHATDYLYDGKSVLLGRKGTIDKPLIVEGKFWTVDTMFYTKIYDDIVPEFLYYTALNIPFPYYSTQTALPSMTQADLSNHLVSIPGFEIQKEIVLYIEQESVKIDTAITKIEDQIKLIGEYKKSLIYQAVTGKISSLI